MFNSRASSFVIGEEQIHVHLRQEITSDKSMMNTINRRIRNRWGAFRKNSIILMSNMLLSLKRKAFDQCVLPTLSYRMETWTLTKRAKVTNNTDKYGKVCDR